MRFDGFGGSILKINLSKEKVKEKKLSNQEIENYLGGWGINAKLFLSNQKPGTNPYSSDSVIVFGVGALVGSTAPGASKITATYKTPIEDRNRNHFIDSAIGSVEKFGINLKRSGVDHFIIEGKAKKPIYLVIDGKRVFFKDADDIWGNLDSYETIDQLKEKENKNPGILTIGAAGENKVSYSMGILDKYRTLGRFGLGGVLGSKNVKAVLTKGDGEVSISKPNKLNRVIADWKKDIIHSGWGYSEYLKRGINAKFNFLGEKAAEGPMSWEKAMEVYGYDKYKELAGHCSNKSDISCPIPCRSSYKIKEGEFKGDETYTGNWFLPTRIGQRLNIEDANKALKLLDICNRTGMCVFTASQIINWITSLAQRNELKTTKFGLRRDFKTYTKLLEKINQRKDIGDVLAQGWRPIEKEINRDPENHVTGTGIIQGVDPIQDGRNTTLNPQAFQHLTGTRPHHGGHQSLYTRPNRPLSLLKKDAEKMGLTKEELDRVFTKTSYYGSFNVGRYAKHAEDHMAVLNSLGMCGIHAYWGDYSEILDLNIKYTNIELLSKIYELVTGINMTPRKLKKKGEKSFNLYRLLQVREGIDGFPKLPETWFKKKKTPDGVEIKLMDYYRKNELTKEDVRKLREDYRKERKWDKKAIPISCKKQELGVKI